MLQSASIHALASQGKAGAVAKHVDVDSEGQLGDLASSLIILPIPMRPMTPAHSRTHRPLWAPVPSAKKLKEQANAVRVEYMHRYGRVVLRVVGSTLRAHHVIAVVAVLLISFGVKMFFLSSAPTAEANIRAVPSASVNVLQMHRDVDTKSLPVQKNERQDVYLHR